jgi:hypothetical protein
MNAIILTYAVVVLLIIIAQWKIYEKAGEAGWACIIPIYSFYILLRIIGKPWWWILMMLVPFVNLIFAIWALNLLSKSFGKSEGFTLGMIFFPFIFYPILGFGSAEYQGAQSKEAQLEKQANSL